MATICKNFIDTLKANTVLSDVFRHYGIEIKKSGSGFVCRSPFGREDKTPSLSISDPKGIWTDFGGEHKGDAIKFIELYENLSFPQAVERLAKIQGVEMVYEQRQDQRAQHTGHYEGGVKEVIQVNEWARGVYNQTLTSNQGALQYLSSARGISHEMIDKFQIGYAPDGFGFIRDQVKRDFHQSLVHADILISREKDGKTTTFDKFRNRIMFPIRDPMGRTVGFGGRVITADSKEAKYINSADTPAFKKGNTLYGLYESLQCNNRPERIIVTEGYLDVIAMHQRGINSTVSTNGTAITPQQIKLLFKYTDQVTFLFDGDKAGVGAAKKAMDCALEQIEDGRSIGFAFLPSGHDPDSMLRQYGAQPIQQLLSKPVSLSQFALMRIKDQLDLTNEADLSRMARNAVQILSKMPNGLYRDHIVSNVCQSLNISPERVIKAVDEHSVALKKKVEVTPKQN